MFEFKETLLEGVVLVVAETHLDVRGFFRETYKRSEFHEAGIRDEFTQSNCSVSAAGVLRGLHFQTAPASVAKLVSASHGSLFDVAVDVREGSPTRGKFVAEVLSQTNGKSLFVPQGFAHGFLALEDQTVATYLMAGEFAPGNDAGIFWDDPELGIPWKDFGLRITTSVRDASLPRLLELS